jgi:hypothetical protein
MKKKKSSADFTFYTGLFYGRKCIVIIDEDKGNRSVTNDIDNVVSDIEAMRVIDSKEYLVVYRDSIGQWTGWSRMEGFVGLQAKDELQAIRQYNGMQQIRSSFW